MIEMLGVLAIIGVLSAGGIWAYSVAMENYKVNKTIEDVGTVLANANYLFDGRSNLGGNIGADKLLQIGVIPKSYAKTLKNRVCGGAGANYAHPCLLNPFGQDWLVQLERVNRLAEEVAELKDGSKVYMRKGESYVFDMHILTPSKSSCVKLARHNWGNDYVTLIGGWKGESYLAPLSPANAEALCYPIPRGIPKGLYYIHFLPHKDIAKVER